MKDTFNKDVQNVLEIAYKLTNESCKSHIIYIYGHGFKAVNDDFDLNRSFVYVYGKKQAFELYATVNADHSIELYKQESLNLIP